MYIQSLPTNNTQFCFQRMLEYITVQTVWLVLWKLPGVGKTPEKTEKHFYLLVSAHIKAVLKLHNIYSVYGTPAPFFPKSGSYFCHITTISTSHHYVFFFLESDSRTASYLGQLAAPCIDLSLFVLHCCPFQTSQMAQKRNPVRKRCCLVRAEFNPTSADLVAHSVLRKQALCLGGSRC